MNIQNFKELPKSVQDWYKKQSKIAGMYDTSVFKKVFLEFVKRHRVYEPPELAISELDDLLREEEGHNYPEDAETIYKNRANKS